MSFDTQLAQTKIATEYDIKVAEKGFSFLSGETYRSRRNLIGFSATIFFLLHYNLKVEGASALGMTVKNLNTTVLIVLLSVVAFYEMVAFILRIINDWTVWKVNCLTSIKIRGSDKYPQCMEAALSDVIRALTTAINNFPIGNALNSNELRHLNELLKKYYDECYYTGFFQRYIAFGLLEITLPILVFFVAMWKVALFLN